MGLWDSFTDIFTGDPVHEAAAQQRAYYDMVGNQVRGDLTTARTTGMESLGAGRTGGLESLRSGGMTGRTDIASTLDPSLRALFGGVGAGEGALTDAQRQALSSITGGVAGATAAYDPVAAAAGRYGEAGGLARTMSENALGLRGPEGNVAAEAAFREGPGYDFAVDEGLEAIMRNANAAGGGNLLGGNFFRESQKFGQGTADQEYQRWVNQLQGRENLYAPLERGALTDVASGTAGAELSGGNAAASVYGNTGTRLADLYSTGGRNVADVYGRTGTSLADLASKQGMAEASLFGDTAGREATLIGNLAGVGANFQGNFAGQYGKTYGDEAQADMAGSNSLWNLIGGTAKLAAGGGWLPSGGNTPWKL